MNFVFTGSITPIGNQAAIRRPGWAVVKGTTAPGKVKGKPFFSRDIKQFTSGFKRHPGPARRCSHAGNAPAHVFSPRQLSREIAHHINHHLLKLQLRGIHTVEITPGSEYEL